MCALTHNHYCVSQCILLKMIGVYRCAKISSARVRYCRDSQPRGSKDLPLCVMLHKLLLSATKFFQQPQGAELMCPVRGLASSNLFQLIHVRGVHQAAKYDEAIQARRVFTTVIAFDKDGQGHHILKLDILQGNVNLSSSFGHLHLLSAHRRLGITEAH
eukprot:TRINITY_DN1556_c0_g1_i1.p1 TRINITY_DN1556_c0_g1~~TRINITY_DN1556_c0_g1_i1.p1  ORF type:complete len:174 (-),score=2.62 TRINITY_DN1556_c0_g1_i1:555-1031(-)